MFSQSLFDYAEAHNEKNVFFSHYALLVYVIILNAIDHRLMNDRCMTSILV